MAVKEGWKGRVFEDFQVGDVYEHPLGRRHGGKLLGIRLEVAAGRDHALLRVGDELQHVAETVPRQARERFGCDSLNSPDRAGQRT